MVVVMVACWRRWLRHCKRTTVGMGMGWMCYYAMRVCVIVSVLMLCIVGRV